MALNVETFQSSFAQIKVNSLEVTKVYTMLFTDYPEVQPFVCQYPYGKAE